MALTELHGSSEKDVKLDGLKGDLEGQEGVDMIFSCIHVGNS